MKRLSGRRSPALAIHLNPVSVSAYPAPAADAILASMVAETIVVATSGRRSLGLAGPPAASDSLKATGAACAPVAAGTWRLSRYAPRSDPTWSPVSVRHPPGTPS